MLVCSDIKTTNMNHHILTPDLSNMAACSVVRKASNYDALVAPLALVNKLIS